MGIWRRVHLVPFTTVIPPDKCDKDRDRRPQAELPGILRWAAAGRMEWQRTGLRPPAAIQEATEEYRRGQDVLREFLDECCVLKPMQQVTSRALYKRYQEWCSRNGERDESAKWLWNRLAERGITKKRVSQDMPYYGIGLQTTDEDARYAR